MKSFNYFWLAIIFLVSCKNGQNTDASTKDVTLQDSVSVATSPIKSDLKALEKEVGKLPSEAGLFTKFGISERIEKIMGENYADFKTDWNTETPIKKDGEIIYAIGCRADVCIANRYVLIIDVLQNGINVYNFKHDKGKSYEEDRTIIGMPFKLQDEFEKIRSEHGL